MLRRAWPRPARPSGDVQTCWASGPRWRSRRVARAIAPRGSRRASRPPPRFHTCFLVSSASLTAGASPPRHQKVSFRVLVRETRGSGHQPQRHCPAKPERATARNIARDRPTQGQQQSPAPGRATDQSGRRRARLPRLSTRIARRIDRRDDGVETGHRAQDARARDEERDRQQRWVQRVRHSAAPCRARRARRRLPSPVAHRPCPSGAPGHRRQRTRSC